MKTTAAVLYESGRPAPYAESRPLVIEAVDLAAPGPGEALVEMAAAGLCHSDLSVINGTRLRPLPLVLGHEGAGIVRATGPGKTALQAGDHVVFSFVAACGECPACAAGRYALCDTGNAANASGQLITGARRFSSRRGPLNHHQGVSAYSQFTVAAERSLVRIPKAVPLETAVLFGCAVLTGAGAVTNTAAVCPGATVAVFGLGGVGLSAVMGARASAATTIIAVDIQPHKLELARAAGATHVLNARESDAVEAIRDLTGGGVDYAFEAAGSERVLEQAWAATNRGGTTVAIGLPHPEKAASINTLELVAGERRLLGSYMGSCAPRRDILRFLQMYERGLLPVGLLKSRDLRLDDINEGFDALAAGQVARQVVVFPAAGVVAQKAGTAAGRVCQE